MPHPTLDQLTQLAEGVYGALARARLEEHLAQCTQCSAELEWLTAISAHVRLEAIEAVPDSVAANARCLFRPGAHAGRQAVLERLVGSLRFDSGVRGSHKPNSRQLLFEAGAYDLELHTAAARAGWSVSGQLLGPTDAMSGEVRLIGARAMTHSALTDMLEFNLPVVPPGRYRLELLVGDATQVDIDALDLGR